MFRDFGFPATFIAACAIAVVACAPLVPPKAPEWEVSAWTSEWRFDEDLPGEMPASWVAGETNGQGAAATWAVFALPNAPSLPNTFGVMQSNNTGNTYNVAIAERGIYADFELSVEVKPIAGGEDQGGGPIWRCIDPSNYYVCRWNPLEENIRLYKVVQGVRRQLDSAPARIEEDHSATIGVTMQGAEIVCTLNETPVLQFTDDTLSEPGRIGLWTKADAVTLFDNLIVTPLE